MSPKIDYEEIAKLVNFLEEKKLIHFELEIEGFKIKISRATTTPNAAYVPASTAVDAASPAEASKAESASKTANASAGNIHSISSPMVGTFYRTPNPNSPPFIEIGDQVKKGQTLCIIEAMKLMNEIEADIDGIIKEIYIENAKPVEYGQKLFAIQPLS